MEDNRLGYRKKEHERRNRKAFNRTWGWVLAHVI